MQRQPALKPGDTVALVAPASPFARGESGPEDILAGVRARLGELGLRVVVAPNATQRYGYLAGPDADRARDLMAAFTDPEVNAILCMGGGYGTPRILDLLDYDFIAHNPKIFVGYSDITALHTAIGQRAGLVTFHGPMGFEVARIHHTLGGIANAAGFSAGGTIPVAKTHTQAHQVTSKMSSAPQPDRATADFTWQWFVRALMQPEPLGELPAQAPWQDAGLQSIVPGVARGQLVGGNLSLLSDTLGTPYEIDTADKIVLIEEIGEAPYRIDRMLTQLRLAGKLHAAAGFIIAEWTDCEPSDPSRPTLTLRQVLADIIEPLGKPTVYGLAAGHGPGRLTLPLGVPVSVYAGDAPVGASAGAGTGAGVGVDAAPENGCRIVVEEAGVSN